MRKFAPKPIFSILTMRRTAADSRQWDRVALVFSTVVTLGLAAMYLFGKATSRW
jgi:hypothetical protein